METYKRVILIGIAFVIIAVIFWPKNVYVINEVVDGQTIRLDNGAYVRLIGVSSTVQSSDALDSYISQKVEFKSDIDYSFDTDHIRSNDYVYAYVLLPDSNDLCINSELLKQGLCELDETHLVDSLSSYYDYVHSFGVPQKKLEPRASVIPEIDWSEDGVMLQKYEFKERHQYGYFTDSRQHNINMLQTACDYNSNYTKMFANQLAGRAPGVFSIRQVCAIFDYCYKKWKYVRDPKGQEYLARASESIGCYLAGDCDDFAVLMASCIIAVGGDANIVIARTTDSGHAYAEVDVTCFDKFSDDYMRSVISEKFPSFSGSINIRNDGMHRWLNLDWQSPFPGGGYYPAISRENYSCVDGIWQ